MSVEQPMWDAMSSWFTPTTLFLLLNFMIATIFLTSGSRSSHKPFTNPDLHQPVNLSQHQQTEPILLQRSPSVLQRLKSINFHHYANYYKPVEPTNIHTHEPHIESHHTAPFESKDDQNDYDVYQNPEVPQRPPSVLQRLKSINFTHFYKPVGPSYNYNDEPVETMPFNENMYQNDDVEEEEGEDQFGHGEDSDPDRSIDDVYSELKVQRGSNFVRTRSDTEPSSGAVPVKLVKKMKKSASSKSAFRHFSEAEVVEARRPATARVVKRAVEGEDAEVDVKADDFINKFKQQLKLQRLDSILRYKEMLGRGAGK